MKQFRVLMLMSVLLMFAVGSFASAYVPDKSKCTCKVEFVKKEISESIATNLVKYDAVLSAPINIDEVQGYCVTLTIGEVVNKPFTNYRWLNIQRFYI